MTKIHKSTIIFIPVIIVVIAGALIVFNSLGVKRTPEVNDPPDSTFDRRLLESKYKHWPDREPDYSQMKVLAENNNDFACELYARLVSDNNNLTYSPFSISTALAMIYAGAKGRTKQQIKDVLHFNMTDSELLQSFGDQCYCLDQVRGESHGHYGYAELMGMETSDEFAGLIIGGVFTANSIWIDDRFTILDEYKRLVTEDFNSEISTVDFSNTSEIVRSINTWTADQTLGQVPQIVRPENFGEDSVMALVSCIAFDLGWPINDNYDVKDLHFRISKFRKIKVPTMYKSQKYPVALADDFTVISMPLCDDGVALRIILPNDTFGINGVESQLTGELIEAINENFKETEVDLFLPKFSIQHECYLVDELKQMGMSDVFSGELADLSGMGESSRGNVFVGKIIHKACTEVNEEGVGAAAATAIISYDCITEFQEPPERIEFKADHPFIFLIQDTSTNAILFMGRIMNPLQTEPDLE